MNTKRIDVLAVMDARIKQAASNWKYLGQDDGPEPPSIVEFREARSAVAELIEAAKDARWRIANLTSRDGAKGLDRATLDRLDASIARVGAA